MDDEEIIALYIARDETAINATSRKYSRSLQSISRKIIRNQSDVEECENDTYLSAWNAIPPNAPNTYFFVFLARIIRQKTLDLYRKKNRHKRKAIVLELSHELEECIPSSSDTSISIEDKEFCEVLSRFLLELNQEARVVFTRRYWYFDSIIEISKKYKISESKVKSMLFRTRNKLRLYLKQEGYEI